MQELTNKKVDSDAEEKEETKLNPLTPNIDYQSHSNNC